MPRDFWGGESNVNWGSTKHPEGRIGMKCAVGTALWECEGNGILPWVTHTSLVLPVQCCADGWLKQNTYNIWAKCPWYSACAENISWGLRWSPLDLVLCFVFNSIFCMETYWVLLHFCLLSNSMPLEGSNCYWLFVVYPSSSLSMHLYM